MIEIQVDGFVVGYVEEWVYNLLYPILESELQQGANKLVESHIEDGPSMKDLYGFVRK